MWLKKWWSLIVTKLTDILSSISNKTAVKHSTYHWLLHQSVNKINRPYALLCLLIMLSTATTGQSFPQDELLKTGFKNCHLFSYTSNHSVIVCSQYKRNRFPYENTSDLKGIKTSGEFRSMRVSPLYSETVVELKLSSSKMTTMNLGMLSGLPNLVELAVYNTSTLKRICKHRK